MTEEPESPRRGRGVALDLALKEDLDLFSVGDLEERIALLGGEIARCRAQIALKSAGREAADALFKSPGD